MKPDYEISYEPSFVIFWGLMLAGGLLAGGLLMLAFIATAILTLIHHEHAHLKTSLERNVKINYVKFTWLGGLVDADITYAHDAVPIYSAGVINSGCYAVVFAGALISINYLGRNVWTGFNFANNPYLQFLNSITMFAVVMVVTNILPIAWKSKKYGIVSTDGYAAYKFVELRDELWNDGKSLAMMVR